MNSYDNWKLNVPEQEGPLHHCDFCDTSMFDGDSVIEYQPQGSARLRLFCSEDCYQEILIRANEPNYIKLRRCDF